MVTKTINISRDELETFLERMNALNKISNVHKVLWNEKSIFYYSMDFDNMANGKPKINALKIFLLKRDEMFKEFPSDLNLNWVILQCDDFVKKYKLLFNSDDEYFKMKIGYNDELNEIETMSIRSTKLELTSVVGTTGIKIKDIPLEYVKSSLNYKNAEWSLELEPETFKEMKTLSKYEDKQMPISLNVDNGKVQASQSSWYYELGNVEYNDSVTYFSSEHLSKIMMNTEKIRLSVFDTYILINEDSCMTMCTVTLC